MYQAEDGRTSIDVHLENETVWLTQAQMMLLFQRDQSVISRHIKNIFDDEELNEKSNMQFLHIANSDKPIAFYNLDVIISVGYRVKSKQGTQFRIWANSVLKNYLIKGYAINEKRLKEQQNLLNELAQTVALFGSVSQDEELRIAEAKGLLGLITGYAHSFVLMNQFDSNSLQTNGLNFNVTYEIQYSEARQAIDELKNDLIARKEATQLFGNEKDQSFGGILGNIVQTFGGEYLYPTIEEQAAHLLYFVIKNHPFSDGNKRIGSFLFVWFLEKNKHRFNKKGEVKINENALVALALLVAQSNPSDKELMVKLIINLINQ